MRDSITGAWLYGIVIIFMAFFIAFIAITVNYSNAFKLSTELVTIIEQYNGVDDRALALMNEKIRNSGYLQTGTCSSKSGQSVNNDEKYFGVYEGVPSRRRQNYNFCVARSESSDGGRNVESKYYYTVTVFFGFDLPFFNRIFTFRVLGSTGGIPEDLRNRNEYFESDKYDKLQT